ncbi:dTDP-4-dehydrorhamnose reductase family protein [Winogradskyella sp.]|uniref:dTDP-4-dehydrorhamnose reductase family protein n=1 Tax=Winogradskyella sp. TaxID=1883156 RepID=UPI003BAD79FF
MEKVNKSILILGATGMLGHVVYTYFQKHTKYELFNLVYRNKLNENSIVCDVTNKSELEKKILKINPSIIINCIGVLIKGSQSDPSNAIYLNAYLPHNLVNICNRINAKLIHVSTDCVFSGKKGNYSEYDFRDADDIYGRSKSLGEVISEPHLTLRTSIIGPEIKAKGEGLFHWFMNQKKEIHGYEKVMWGGVTTIELSKAIDFHIKNGTYGIINITNNQKISKLDLLRLLNKYFNKNQKLNIIPNDLKVSDKSLVTIRKNIRFEVSSYESMISELYEYFTRNHNQYKDYYFEYFNSMQ